MQVGGDAEGLQKTILISVGTGTSTLVNFFRYCTKKNVEVGSEGE